MNIELQRTLKQRFPLVLRKVRAGGVELGEVTGQGTLYPVSASGIECGDGWYDIVAEACDYWEHRAEELLMQGVRRHSLPVFLQIKGKLGRIQFWIDMPKKYWRHDEYWPWEEARLDLASATNCECCGRGINRHFWRPLLCEECDKSATAEDGNGNEKD